MVVGNPTARDKEVQEGESKRRIEQFRPTLDATGRGNAGKSER